MRRLCEVEGHNLLELGPCSATLWVVVHDQVRGSMLALFSALTTPLDKEATP